VVETEEISQELNAFNDTVGEDGGERSNCCFNL